MSKRRRNLLLKRKRRKGNDKSCGIRITKLNSKRESSRRKCLTRSNEIVWMVSRSYFQRRCLIHSSNQLMM
jgi:hypothetical protein